VAVKPNREDFGNGVTVFLFRPGKDEYAAALELTFSFKGTVVVEKRIAGDQLHGDRRPHLGIPEGGIGQENGRPTAYHPPTHRDEKQRNVQPICLPALYSPGQGRGGLPGSVSEH
jgi:hypothetical protein